jgi:signal transduction histidine kinase
METLVALCDFEPSNLFLFSDKVPPLVYFSHFPITVISLLIGIFVFLQSPRQLANRIFLFMTASFAFWVFLDSIFWASNRSDIIMFAWSAIILIEPLIYASGLYLAYVMLNKIDAPLTTKLIASTLLLPLFIFAPSNFNLSAFDIQSCLAVEGPLALYYTYILEGIFLAWLIVFAVAKYRSAKVLIQKREVLLLAIGIGLFFGIFTTGNLFGSFTSRWEIAQFGLFGMPLFLGFISYMMVRFQTFNARLFGTQVLVIAMWVLLLSLLAIQKVENVRIVVIASFVLFFILGQQLIRGVRREIEARHKVEQLADNLSSANQRLTELDTLKSEFVSMASHQLRTPLTSILGYSSLVLEGSFGKVSKGVEDAIHKVFTSTKFLVGTVDDFLNISRIELGRMKYDKSVFDFSELAKTVVDDLHPMAESKGLKLAFKADGGEGNGEYSTYADLGKMKQVVSNLVDNAIKYTKEGSIEVSIERGEDEHSVLFSVSDTGIGFSSATAGRLFSKFERATNASQSSVSGTGLGLYVARMMVEAQGGKINATSEGEGKGSIFTVDMPLSQQ